MAKESIPFTKYPALHQLENYVSQSTIGEYIQHSRFSENFHQLRRRKPEKCKFFSFLTDGFADAGNLEDELIVVQYSMKDSNSKEVKSIVLVRLKLIIN